MTTNNMTLEIMLHGEHVGSIVQSHGTRSQFHFLDSYVSSTSRPTLGIGLMDEVGDPKAKFRPHSGRVMPFFSNLLPEGALRECLASWANVRSGNEFELLWALGEDLAGAVAVRSANGGLPRRQNEKSQRWRSDDREDGERVMRFSLSGVQLKFSAVMEPFGGLTIPARGVGGSWVVKLPSAHFKSIPENEYSMMTLAKRVGIEVPEIALIRLDEIGGLPVDVNDIGSHAFAIERFDRTPDGGAVHIEDFAQVFGVFPERKYDSAKMRRIGRGLTVHGSDNDLLDMVRRLVFNALIGNGDMHLKNWSLIYKDRRTPSLSPAYDYVSTVPYIQDENLALVVSRTKKFHRLDRDEIEHLATKLAFPKKPVLGAVDETVQRFHEVWSAEKRHLPMSSKVLDAIESHIGTVPIAKSGA